MGVVAYSMDKFLTKTNNLPRLKRNNPQIHKAPLNFRNGITGH
jgi:hypothetical protein